MFLWGNWIFIIQIYWDQLITKRSEMGICGSSSDKQKGPKIEKEDKSKKQKEKASQNQPDQFNNDHESLASEEEREIYVPDKKLEKQRVFASVFEELGMIAPKIAEPTKTDPEKYELSGPWGKKPEAKNFDSTSGYFPSKWTGVKFLRNPNPFKKGKDLQCDGTQTIGKDGNWKITEDTYEKVIFVGTELNYFRLKNINR